MAQDERPSLNPSTGTHVGLEEVAFPTVAEHPDAVATFAALIWILGGFAVLMAVLLAILAGAVVLPSTHPPQGWVTGTVALCLTGVLAVSLIAIRRARAPMPVRMSVSAESLGLYFPNGELRILAWSSSTFQLALRDERHGTDFPIPTNLTHEYSVKLPGIPRWVEVPRDLYAAVFTQATMSGLTKRTKERSIPGSEATDTTFRKTRA
ncbi:MAG: hypothetical protein L3K07_03275 [Thermoplasmata archaeon]|nr:hypothetical protein [Thermoplasmata archaeon]